MPTNQRTKRSLSFFPTKVASFLETIYWLLLLFFQPLFSSDISQYLKECFPNTESIAFTPLSGGYSGSEHFQINQSYVLKLLPAGYPSTSQAKRELFTLSQASELGIAPKIHWVSADKRALLMDFVEGELLTIASAKKNLIAIAKTLRKVHELPKCPYERQRVVQRMVDLYHYLKELYPVPPELDKAVQKIKAIPLPNGPRVTIHGDLNARNIFLTPHGIQLIDWSETSWEDPFYDLTCFTLLHNFTADEEELFLQTYLGSFPSFEEKARFDLIKQISMIDFSVNLIFLAHTMGIELQDGPVLDPSYYTTQFADKREELSPQFFYDWGRSYCGFSLRDYLTNGALLERDFDPPRGAHRGSAYSKSGPP